MDSIVSHHDRDGLFGREHTGYSCMRAKERGARDWESYQYCTPAAIYGYSRNALLLVPVLVLVGHGGSGLAAARVAWRPTGRPPAWQAPC